MSKSKLVEYSFHDSLMAGTVVNGRKLLHSIIALRELKNVLPPLSQVEREQLKQNIKNDGAIREPITLTRVDIGFPDKQKPYYVITDGHNRNEIKEELEIEEIKVTCSYIIKNFKTLDEAKNWMLANNLGRRSLSESQKAEYALKLSRTFAGKRGGDVKSEEAKKQEQKEQNAPFDEDKKASEKVAKALNVKESKAKRLIREGKAVETLKGAGDTEYIKAYDNKEVTKGELLERAKSIESGDAQPGERTNAQQKKIDRAIDMLKRSGTAKAKTALNEFEAENITDNKLVEIANELKEEGKIKPKKKKATNITRSHELADEMRHILEKGEWLEQLIQSIHPSATGKPYKSTLKSFFREIVIREENGKTTRKGKEAFDRYRIDFLTVCQPKNTVFRPLVVGIEIKIDEHDMRTNYEKIETYRQYCDYFFLATSGGLLEAAKEVQAGSKIEGIGLIKCGLLVDDKSEIVTLANPYKVPDSNAMKMAHELLIKEMRYGGE